MRASSGGIRASISLVVSAILFGSALWIAFNQQFVIDKIAVLQYEPSAKIVELTNEVNFADEGKFYFYAAHPIMDGTSSFNTKCERQEKESAILGCYVNNAIYIFDVTNEKLAGVEAVTAAHEMLHVAYRRLSTDEKQRINTLLSEEYAKLNDADLRSRMEYYERTEPGQKFNELHSIIATEFHSVSPELEKYFSRYFKDRQKIVSLHSGYNSQFKELSGRQKDLGSQLDTLAGVIKRLSDQYNSAVNKLNTDISSFNERAQSGQFESAEQFNVLRAQLLAQSNQLASLRKEVNDKVAQYEVKRTEYNNIVDEANKLHESLDSSLAPPPSL
jgi:hypothetical protein